jgi:hypothetical protein
MTASESTSPHQFGEMHRRLKEEGGFTYDPRKKEFLTSGYSVAAHPAAELTVKHAAGGATPEHIEGYTVGSAPIWQQQKAKGRGQEAIGGWSSDEGEKDVLDLPKVYPATPSGHTKSRQAQILRNQEASFSLHEMAEDPNPWFTGNAATEAAPGHMSAQFPEFANVVAKNPNAALDPEKYPEIASWANKPVREAGYAKEQKRKARGQT